MKSSSLVWLNITCPRGDCRGNLYEEKEDKTLSVVCFSCCRRWNLSDYNSAISFRKLILGDLVIIGFTGTQKGMTEEQKRYIGKLLHTSSSMYNRLSVKHGDCIGSDSEFHNMSKREKIKIYIYPSIQGKIDKRAYCKGAAFITTPRPPLERNRAIVITSSILVATPKEDQEVIRSGTWSTIRYAVNVGTPVIIVYPDGKISKIKRKYGFKE